MRWLIAIRLVILPFQAPLVVNAQSNQVTPPPACEFQLNPLKPGLFCVSDNLEFKPGDSNTTIEQHQKNELRLTALKRARALAAASAAKYEQDIAINGTRDSVLKLYRESGQCVPFARAESGVSIVGTARNVSVNSNDPKIGSVMISYDSNAGHASVVVGIEGLFVRVRDRNWIPGWVTEHLVPLNSSRIKGFVTKS